MIFLLCTLLSGSIIAQDKQEKKIINLKVVDESGAGIPRANVVVGEGMIHIETDENGSLSFNAYSEDFVTISASGYEKYVSLVREINKENTVKLLKSALYMTLDDDVTLPYVTLKKRQTTGSYTVVTGNQLEKYPSIDIRNAFTGLVLGLQITEKDGSTGMNTEEGNGNYGITEKIGVSARGRGIMYIIDDIPTNVTEMQLDPQEIETVTIIKDIVGKAMYGPAGAGGVILIRTKRGRMHERVLNVNVEDGVNVIDRMPGWTNGADYARFNNQARENDELTPLYSAYDIDAYARNNPYDMYHPSVNYKDKILKNTKTFRRANISSSGGNDKVQYSAYIGYNGEGDIYKIGPTSDYNRLTARSNIDMKINKWMKMQFDIYGGLTFRRSPNYGYAIDESSSEMGLIELNSVLTNITNTPPNAFPVYANNDPSLKDPWFGVSSNYPINPIGNILYNGYYTETGRVGNVKTALDYDLSQLVKGLKSRTFFSFETLNLVRIGKAENYIAYYFNSFKNDCRK